MSPETIRAHMTTRTDDELRKIVTVEAHDYRDEALALAWAELRARGISDVTRVEGAAIQERDAQELPTRWLTFYAVATPLAATLDLLGELSRRHLGTAAATCLLVFAPACLLGWGLNRRRHWAYRLNLLFLAWDVVAMAQGFWQHPRASLLVAAAVALVWAWPNYVYFKKRVHLFL